MSSELDPVWKALADPMRRELLDVLSAGSRTTGELVETFPDLCRTAVMKHMDVLEKAGLLVIRREGRYRHNHLNPMPIQRVYDRWVARHVQGTAQRLSRLKNYVESGIEPNAEPASRELTPSKPRNENDMSRNETPAHELRSVVTELEVEIDASPEKVWTALTRWDRELVAARLPHHRRELEDRLRGPCRGPAGRKPARRQQLALVHRADGRAR